MQVAQESLLSANEELQSANEELTTSREEMQSVNEELQTVNAELQARVDALARASDDMENLLNSTEIATLFLDQNLNVRRYTTRATNLIKLIPGDVGRPITDIVSDMKDSALADDAREVLRTMKFKERQVSATEGRWFMVRTMPYCTQDNRIDGVVITFSDISVAKRLEASLRQVQGEK
jgi:two-component system CheB/CheR fusion protein